MRLYVGNLAYSVTSQSLEQLFGEYGQEPARKNRDDCAEPEREFAGIWPERAQGLHQPRKRGPEDG